MSIEKRCDRCQDKMKAGETSSDSMTVRLQENATFAIGWNIMGPQDQCSCCNAILYRKLRAVINEHFDLPKETTVHNAG